MSAMIGGAKGKQIKQVSAGEKENATSVMSDGEPAGSLFPAPPLPGEHSSLSPSVISKNESKTSGTFLPRLPHTSVTPTLSSLKRKRTPDLKDDDQLEDESKKKSRLSKSIQPEDDFLDASMTSSDPCTPVTSSSMVGDYSPDFKDESTVE